MDVELRRDMWALVRRLREGGVTIILTTHYIDEAEEMADRIGVIDKGALVVVDEKAQLMRSLGAKHLVVHLAQPMESIPSALSAWRLALGNGGRDLELTYDAREGSAGIPAFLRRLDALGIGYSDLETRETSLEEIFVSLVGARA